MGKIDLLNNNVNANSTVLLHFGDNKKAFVQLNYWKTEFDKLNVDYCVMVRKHSVYLKIIETYPDDSIIFALNSVNIETVLNELPNLKIVFYTSNTGNNVHLLRFNFLQHIYIGSENSDYLAKITRFIRAYDQIWISGEAVKEKINKVDFSLAHLKFVFIGKPQFRKLLGNVEKINNNILFLPSWEGKTKGANVSFLELLPELLVEIQKLIPAMEINIFLHSKLGKRDKLLKKLSSDISEFYEYENIFVYDKNKYFGNKIELMQSAQYIICDIETFNQYCLASQAVLFLYLPERKRYAFENNSYRSYDYVYVFETVEQLLDLLSQVYSSGDDRLRHKREFALEYWLGKSYTMRDCFYNKVHEELQS